MPSQDAAIKLIQARIDVLQAQAVESHATAVRTKTQHAELGERIAEFEAAGLDTADLDALCGELAEENANAVRTLHAAADALTIECRVLERLAQSTAG